MVVTRLIWPALGGDSVPEMCLTYSPRARHPGTAHLHRWTNLVITGRACINTESAMGVTIDTNERRNAIRAYEPGLFNVNGHALESDIIIHRDKLELIELPDTLAEFDLANVAKAVRETAPDMVIFGTGERRENPSAELMRQMALLGVGYEVMDTGAACRTYNLLLGDGRPVLAFLKRLPLPTA